MSGDIPPVGAVPPNPPVSERRDGDRRRNDRRASASRDLVPIEGENTPAESAPARAAAAPPPDANPSAFAAQMIDQGGQRRGLKGGPPVLDSARNTYLGREHSGEAERRPPPGKLKDTDI